MKKLFTFIIALALLPNFTFAAIAVDNFVVGKTTVKTTSLSLTLVTNNASMLICGLQSDGAGAGAPTSESITYNSAAMTEAVSISPSFYSSDWYLANPTNGSHTVAISWTNSTWLTAGCVSFTGTASTIGATASNNGSGNISVPITTMVNNSWLVDSVYQNNGALSMTAGGTQQYDTTTSADGFRGWGQSVTTTTAGSYTDSWTQGSGAANTWGATVIEIEPGVAAAVATTPLISARWW